MKFNTGAPISDARNSKCLQHVMERGLTSKLKQLYGSEVVSMIGLARAQLYTSLAATATHIPAPIARYGLKVRGLFQDFTQEGKCLVAS